MIYEIELRLQSPIPIPVTILAETSEPLLSPPPETPPDKPSRLDISLSYLPSIQLRLRVPLGYPLNGRPTLMSMRAPYQWLPASLLVGVRKLITDTIDHNPSPEEGDLCRIFELASGDRLPFLFGAPERIVLSHPTPELLASHLFAHNYTASNQSFNQQSFACPICLCTVKGAQCVQLEKCGHVACRRCLGEFWAISIQTGEFEKVNCVQQECVKAATRSDDPIWSVVGEEEVRNVVGEELTVRWKLLREKRTVDRGECLVISLRTSHQL
jgi:E3 ubiquitin-protein ligase RNF14